MTQFARKSDTSFETSATTNNRFLGSFLDCKDEPIFYDHFFRLFVVDLFTSLGVK